MIAGKESANCIVDLGASHASALIVGRRDTGLPRVLGEGRCAMSGLRQGQVVAPQEVADAIGAVVDEAEQRAGVHIDQVHLVVGWAGLRSEDLRSTCTLSRNPRDLEACEVRTQHLEKLHQDSLTGDHLAIDRVVMHSMLQEYIVDGVSGVQRPLGVKAMRLVARHHVVDGPMLLSDNLRRCVEHAALGCASITANLVPATELLLDEDEKELGVVLVDLGAESTSLLVCHGGAPVFSTSIPVGAGSISRDIEKAFHCGRDTAERMKREHGVCDLRALNTDHTFEVPASASLPAMRMTQSQLCQVIQPRMEDVLEMIHERLCQADLRYRLGAGMVLIGGGACLSGLVGMMRNYFALPVRQGFVGSGIECPLHMNGNDGGVQGLAWSATLCAAMHNAGMTSRRVLGWRPFLRSIRNLLGGKSGAAAMY